ncbi:MAG: hypothetical protein SV760_03850, partial [Halobacteria archaeon]|nr:hypothetical protein [Halobacteria archaeon]
MNVDLSNVLDERVGSHGLSESDVSDLEEEIEEVHAGFGNEERFEGYGFLELPEETDAESVQEAGDELSEEFGYFVNVG